MPSFRGLVLLILFIGRVGLAEASHVTGSMKVARAGHTATALPDGRILVAGGEETGSAEIYDPVSGEWTLTNAMAVGRTNHTATLLQDGRVLVAGGDADASAEIFDPATGTWSGTGGMTEARAQHTATLLPSGKVLVVGWGTNTTEIWDPLTGVWSVAEPMSTNRFWLTATLLNSGDVLVVGGESWFLLSGHSKTEIYDAVTGHWRDGPVLSDLRSKHCATLLSDGRVLVAGGEYVPAHPGLIKPLTAEIYDPAMNTWTLTGSMVRPHVDATATLLPNGKVLVVGSDYQVYGVASDFPEARITEIYDPATGTWQSALELETGRHLQTTTLLSSGKVLIAGGVAQDGTRLASAELLDPVRLRVVPDFATLQPKGSISFSATGGWAPDVHWDFIANGSGATLTTDGQYTAGAKDHSTDVVRVTDSMGNFATATVAVASVDRPDAGPSGGGTGAGIQPGCHATGDESLALLALAIVPLLLARRRPGRA